MAKKLKEVKRIKKEKLSNLIAPCKFLNVSIGMLSHKGTMRESNQDKTGSIEIRSSNKFLGNYSISVICLADGCGGMSYGEIYSQLAVQHLINILPYRLNNTVDLCFIPDLISETIFRINRELFYCAAKRNISGGTTLVLAVFAQTEKLGSLLVIANIGDSRAYFIDKENITQVTKDHSKAQELKDNNKEDTEEVKNVITRAIGFSKNVEPDFFQRRIYKEKFSIALTSDGVHSFIEEHELLEAINTHNAQEAAYEIVKKALEKDSDDNCSAVIMKINY